jgi:hypothetical protein
MIKIFKNKNQIVKFKIYRVLKKRKNKLKEFIIIIIIEQIEKEILLK